MKWNIILGSIVLTLGLCTQSFGFGHRHNCGCDTACDTCGSEPTCGVADACGCEPACGCEATCGCESECCPKMKYYKKVCRTHVKRCRTGCGCCKKTTKMCVTKVTYRRVLCPCHHCPDDLICAACKPCGYTTCTPIDCGCGCEPACGCEAACGCEPSCGAATATDAAIAPPMPQADSSAYLNR